MLLTIANVLFVLIAIAMVVLILLQRGAGAAAGSGFGGGASATVFGARGSANFLSKSTAVLATLFFALSLGMAVHANRSSTATPSSDDLGVMGSLAVPSEVPAAEAAPVVPAGDAATPPPPAAETLEVVPAGDVPPATDAAVETDEAAKSEVPPSGQ
jgi:preprotein translocase subunit SecG